jgi:hypothetical protein
MNESTMVWVASSGRMSGLMRVRSNVSLQKWTVAGAFATEASQDGGFSPA